MRFMYRSILITADLCSLLSEGDVSSPQMIIIWDFEKITMSGLSEVDTPVQVGKTRELLKSTRSSQSLAKSSKELRAVGFLLGGFTPDLTNETEMLGIWGQSDVGGWQRLYDPSNHQGCVKDVVMTQSLRMPLRMLS